MVNNCGDKVSTTSCTEGTKHHPPTVRRKNVGGTEYGTYIVAMDYMSLIIYNSNIQRKSEKDVRHSFVIRLLLSSILFFQFHLKIKEYSTPTQKRNLVSSAFCYVQYNIYIYIYLYILYPPLFDHYTTIPAMFV